MFRWSRSSGNRPAAALGSNYQQEVDLQTLFADVTEYVMTATMPGQVRTLIDRAVRIAQAKRAVTCVILPNDLQELTYEDLPMVHGATHTGVGYPGESNLPNADGPASGGRHPERRQEDRDAGRSGLPVGH